MRLRVLLLLALALAGCDPLPGEAVARDPLAPLGDRREEWVEAQGSAERAFLLGRWAEAAGHYERKVGLAAAAPGADGEARGRLSPFVRQDLYNLACCRALLGRTGAALDALEQSLGEGADFLPMEHFLEDPDLASLHGEPRWKALVEAFTWNEEVAVVPGPPGEAQPGSAAVVVVLRGADGGGPAPEPLRGCVTAVPVPPYRLGPGRYAWTTRLDPGEQAARKAVFALEAAGRARGTDPGRRVLLASGAPGVRLAWEILLRRPEAFTRAVLDGPAPPDWALLERGADRVKAEILVTGPEGVPGSGTGAKARVLRSLAAALEEALR